MTAQRKRAPKEPEIELSPATFALQQSVVELRQQLDGMAKFCGMMSSMPNELLEKLQKHKSEEGGSTTYCVSQANILQIVREVRQAQLPPTDK